MFSHFSSSSSSSSSSFFFFFFVFFFFFFFFFFFSFFFSFFSSSSSSLYKPSYTIFCTYIFLTITLELYIYFFLLVLPPQLLMCRGYIHSLLAVSLTFGWIWWTLEIFFLCVWVKPEVENSSTQNIETWYKIIITCLWDIDKIWNYCFENGNGNAWVGFGKTQLAPLPKLYRNGIYNIQSMQSPFITYGMRYINDSIPIKH